MLVRAMGLGSIAQGLARSRLPFRDAAQVAEWARDYMALAREQGIIKGLTATEFGPRRVTTRAEAAVMVVRAMERMGMTEVPQTSASPGGRRRGAPPGRQRGQAGARGYPHEGPNIFMRGPVLRVIEVQLTGE